MQKQKTTTNGAVYDVGGHSAIAEIRLVQNDMIRPTLNIKISHGRGKGKENHTNNHR
jgi:hypothetical protein